MAIPAAIFFELIWLDLFYVGTYVPPQALFSYLVFLPLAAIFQLKSPQEIVPLLALCLPLASLGARVENRLRSLQGRDYHDLLGAIESGGNVAGTLGRSIRKAVLKQSSVFMGLHLCAALLIGLLVWLFGIRLGLWPGQSVPLEPGTGFGSVASRWGLLWTIAAVGGLLALRIRWAQASFVAGVTALAVLWVL